MAYIGTKPTIGNFQICDAISVVNGQAAYTMQVSSVNVIPESANHMLVSLNGILQKPGSSYTVSGSTITFASNLVTGDVIDFIQILGNVLDLGVPSDSTVSLAKLTATGTKDATTFLRGDNSFQEVPAGGITVADQWRYTGGSTFSTEAVINASWERVDTSGQGTIGSAMTESSGIFTFPSTGVYLINFMCNFYKTSGNTRYTYNQINVTTNNSSYADVARGYQALYHISSATYANVSTSSLIDVTSTSNVKVSFSFAADSGVVLQGDTDKNFTHINFIRLGDT